MKNDIYSNENRTEKPFTKGGIPMEGRNIMPSVIIAIALIFFGIMGYVAANRYVKSQAVAACLTAARVDVVRNGEQISGPENFWFTRCLERSGYGNE
jgi:hypothetical protein